MTRDRSRDAPKSAAELMAELEKDPDYVARMQQRAQGRRTDIVSYARAAAPVVADLNAAGFRVATVGELRQSQREYTSAVPILLRWLPRTSDSHVKEEIVRTLSVPWAKPAAAPALIEEFRNTDDATGTGLRWAIANGLAVVADDAVLDDLERLVQDKRYGKAREMLAVALGNVRSPRAVSVLMNLLDDEQVVGHAAMALGQLKAPAARVRLKGLAQHPTKWVREEAKKALANIDSSGPH